MPEGHILYEIEFLISVEDRNGVDEGFSVDILDWIAHEAVCDFQVYRTEHGHTQELKFVFRFESLDDWLTFTSCGSHDRATQRLQRRTEQLSARLWHRGSLPLTDEQAEIRSE
jgi:hypothetical protein